MKVKEPYTIKSRVVLPCDLCGDEVRTISVYLQAKSDRKLRKGYYSDLSIRLCEKCIDKMRDKIRE